MDNQLVATAHRIRAEIDDHIQRGILRFWTTHGIDSDCGGYLTSFDEDGRSVADTDKYLVTQARMIWGYSAFARTDGAHSRLIDLASHGIHFLLARFWDEDHGGWFWRTNRFGEALDKGKVVYGQSFAIYALSEYHLATGDRRAAEFAERTFDLLQKYAADNQHGGYYENLEPDWSPSAPGFAAGDRKSLDIHMHLLEAFTTLCLSTGKEIHRRKLREVAALIAARMIDPVSGAGRNQFDLSFNSLPAISIRRTWNAERKTGETIAAPVDSTSFGHNIELAWLLSRAVDALGDDPDEFRETVRRLVEHTHDYGIDRSQGGIFRDGLHNGEVVVRDKEWWQNAESLVGFLDAYERFGDVRFFSDFVDLWEFCRDHFIDPGIGEWRQLLDRSGTVIVGSIGNPWKAFYHTGRSMLECRERLGKLITKGAGKHAHN